MEIPEVTPWLWGAFPIFHSLPLGQAPAPSRPRLLIFPNTSPSGPRLIEIFLVSPPPCTPNPCQTPASKPSASCTSLSSCSSLPCGCHSWSLKPLLPALLCHLVGLQDHLWTRETPEPLPTAPIRLTPTPASTRIAKSEHLLPIQETKLPAQRRETPRGAQTTYLTCAS